MSNIRYYNQSGPFWDFIASLEGQGFNNHPMAAAYAGPSRGQPANDESETENDNQEHDPDKAFEHQGAAEHGDEDFPFGWGGPFGFGGNFGPFGGRGGGGGGGRGRGGHGRGRGHGHGPPHHARHGGPGGHAHGPPPHGHGPHSGPPPPGGPGRRGPPNHPGRAPPPHMQEEGEQEHEGEQEQGHGPPGSMNERGEDHGPSHFAHGPHGHRGHCHGPRHGGPHGRRGGGGGASPFNFAGLAEYFQSQLFGGESPNGVARDAEGTSGNGNGDFAPAVDVFDTESAFIVHASLPGAKKEDVAVTWDAEKSELTLAGVVHRPGDEALLATLALDERKVGAFERKIRLGSRANPAVVDVEGITAKLEEGVLRVTVPKEDKDFVEIRMVDVE